MAPSRAYTVIRLTQATSNSACGSRPASIPMPMGRPPRTLSTTTLSGHGFASSRTPISRTWKTARLKAQRYGRSRRSTFPTTRSVPPTRAVPSGCLGLGACGAAIHRPQPETRAHDVVGVIEDAREADVLRDDHAQVHQAECAPDADHLGNREHEPEHDQDREYPEAELRHARQTHLGPHVEEALRSPVVLGSHRHVRLRPDAAKDLQVPAIPAGIDRDQILPREQELHHPAEQRLLLVPLLAPVPQHEGTREEIDLRGLPLRVRRDLLDRREAAQPPEVALQATHERTEIGEDRDQRPGPEA